MTIGQVFWLAFLLLLVALKLMGVIDWSWLWVLAPLWLPMSLNLLGLAVHLVLMAVSPRYRLQKAADDLVSALRRRP